MTADEYVRQVEVALRDLPWRQRKDLIAELRAHLAEHPAETGFVERLGSPEKYAAELRAAAGLERQHGAGAYIRARRPRNVVIAVVALVLALTALGLTIGAVVWVNGYQPLENAGSDSGPLNAKEIPGKKGVTAYFRNGKPFQYGVWVFNDGKDAVHLLDGTQELPDAFAGHLFMAARESSSEPLVPFHPFDLKPRSARWLVFKGVYKCGATPWVDELTLDHFPVKYSFLWRTATASIPLYYPVTVSFAKETCPGAKQ